MRPWPLARAMGCTVEATFYAMGPLLVREQRVLVAGRVAAESRMAWPA